MAKKYYAALGDSSITGSSQIYIPLRHHKFLKIDIC